MSDNCETFERGLYTWEIQEAQRVFGSQIAYAEVRIHECTGWPDSIYRFSRRMQGEKIQPDMHNAVTVGNHCYFPVRLPEQLLAYDDGEFYKIAWLIHELTHVWQYQQMGWRYLAMAVKSQITQGGSAYHFGGEDGLRMRGSAGAVLEDFNLEQQGDIARSYYERLVRGQDTGAWGRYIAQIRRDDDGPKVA